MLKFFLTSEKGTTFSKILNNCYFSLGFNVLGCTKIIADSRNKRLILKNEQKKL